MTGRRRAGRGRFSNRRPGPQRLALVLLVLAVVAVARWWSPPAAPPEALPPGSYGVARVVDGDTLELTNGDRVRLIGLDAPETVRPDHPVEPWGPEAAQFTREFVAGGTVRLEFDVELKDQYGRLLAYVWCDRRLLNEELIRVGLARAEPKYSYAAAMKRRFLQAEAEAKAAGRGLWSSRDGNNL